MGPAAWREKHVGEAVRQCVGPSVTDRNLTASQLLSRLPGVDRTISRRLAAGPVPASRRDDGGRPQKPPVIGIETRQESRQESMETRVLRLLDKNPLGRKPLSLYLGHQKVSGRLNKVIHTLLADHAIEYTIPDKPNSRLQRYRLTEKGRKTVAAVIR